MGVSYSKHSTGPFQLTKSGCGEEEYTSVEAFNSTCGLVLLGHYLDQGCLFALLPLELVGEILRYLPHPFLWKWRLPEGQFLFLDDCGTGITKNKYEIRKWDNITTTQPLKVGRKYYCEITLEELTYGSPCYFGVAQYPWRENYPIQGDVEDAMCWGLHMKGMAYLPGTAKMLDTFVQGNKIGVYVDLILGHIAWFKNGAQIGPVFADARLITVAKGDYKWSHSSTTATIENSSEQEIATALYPTLSLGGDSYHVILTQEMRLPQVSSKGILKVNQNPIGETYIP